MRKIRVARKEIHYLSAQDLADEVTGPQCRAYGMLYCQSDQLFQLFFYSDQKRLERQQFAGQATRFQQCGQDSRRCKQLLQPTIASAPEVAVG